MNDWIDMSANLLVISTTCRWCCVASGPKMMSKLSQCACFLTVITLIFVLQFSDRRGQSLTFISKSNDKRPANI